MRRMSGVAKGRERTVAEELPAGESSGQSDSDWKPFLLHNEGSDHQEGGGDINPIDLIGGEGTGIGDMLVDNSSCRKILRTKLTSFWEFSFKRKNERK